VALGLARHGRDVAAVRAAYAALVLGIVGGLIIATAVLSGRTDRRATVEAVLALAPAGPDLDRRRAEAVAELTAACMAGRGLRWLPVVEPAPRIPDPDLGPIDWARRWGFGVSTIPPGAEIAPGDDPNRTFVETLPVPSHEAYLLALLGDRTTPGCQATASASVYGLRDRLLGPLRPGLTAMDARIAADPANIRAVDRWRACVRPVIGRLAADRRTLPAALLEHFLQRSAAVGRGTRAVAGLAAVQADERRVATVVARCELAYASDRGAAAAPHERAFVEAHRAELTAIGDAIRAAESALPTLPP
jgi:hypothetical protein